MGQRQQAKHGPHLLMPAEDVADGAARECLVDLHGGATRVGKHSAHPLPLQRLHQDVRALAWLGPIPVHPFRSTCHNKGKSDKRLHPG